MRVKLLARKLGFLPVGCRGCRKYARASSGTLTLPLRKEGRTLWCSTLFVLRGRAGVTAREPREYPVLMRGFGVLRRVAF